MMTRAVATKSQALSPCWAPEPAPAAAGSASAALAQAARPPAAGPPTGLVSAGAVTAGAVAASTAPPPCRQLQGAARKTDRQVVSRAAKIFRD